MGPADNTGHRPGEGGRGGHREEASCWAQRRGSGDGHHEQSQKGKQDLANRNRRGRSTR